MTHEPSHNLPNARRIATARAALTAAMAVRADCPIISDDAVIELLAGLCYLCAGRNIVFDLCDLGRGCPELDSVRISEIERVRGGLGLPVERDLYFKPTKTLSVWQ